MRKLLVIIIYLFISHQLSLAQIQRETRAVWLTTNFAADWPPKTYDIQTQKNALREIFQNLKSKYFNTVYFQVRSNGTVLYNSSLEPSSPYITGIVGDDLPYDPLQLAIDLGKEFDLEVHAWVNMVRCFTGENENILSHPQHIRNLHPEWTVRRMGSKGKLSYWLNPGLPEVQEYLTRILLEISSNYDVAGIHLDFFRYPDKDFDDFKTNRNYNFGLTIDDWRRNNLTEILRSFNKRVSPVNPYLKIGATPIGIRKSLEGAIGWEGYSSVYQDTEKWLQESLVDYLTPQIYWSFERNPRFDVLANDWVKKSYGKNIVLGLAAYKPKVKNELAEMINYSRQINAAGISFFRYKHIASIDDSYFTEMVFPQKMDWKNIREEIVQTNFECGTKILSDSEVLIHWENINNNNSRYFTLHNYKSDSIFTTKLISLSKNKLRLKFANPKKLQYKYSVGKVDRLWNETDVCKKFVINVPFLSLLKENASVSTKPTLIKINDSFSVLSLFSHLDEELILEIITKENLITQNKINLFGGQNIFEVKENLKLIKTIRIKNNNDKIINEMSFL